MSDTHPAIQLRKVSFSYDGFPILEDVNLEIWSRDSICIVGPNGGGKTTLIKLITGLLSPTSGTIAVMGREPEEARLHIGYVPQYARYDPQFPVSVFDVVIMGRLGYSITGKYTTDDKDLAWQAIREMRLEKIADRRFSAISGGQRQRAMIARALATGGEILILDEPTANVDKDSEEHFFEILEQLNKRMTILLVTHEVGFASKFFQRIACVNRQVLIHPTSELTGELIRDMYGGDLQMIRHDHQCAKEGHTHA